MDGVYGQWKIPIEITGWWLGVALWLRKPAYDWMLQKRDSATYTSEKLLILQYNAINISIHVRLPLIIAWIPSETHLKPSLVCSCWSVAMINNPNRLDHTASSNEKKCTVRKKSNFELQMCRVAVIQTQDRKPLSVFTLHLLKKT